MQVLLTPNYTFQNRPFDLLSNISFLTWLSLAKFSRSIIIDLIKQIPAFSLTCFVSCVLLYPLSPHAGQKTPRKQHPFHHI